MARSDLVLIDGKVFRDYLKDKSKYALKESKNKSNNDLTQMQMKGEAICARHILKFFNKLKSDI